MLNHVNQRDPFWGNTPNSVFWDPFGPHALKKLPFWSLPGPLWEPSGHLWETFGDQGAPKALKSGPKATQRLQGCPKRLQKDETTRLSREVWRLFNNFLLFSRIGFYLAPIGAYWLLLAPLGFYWLLLALISSYCLLLPLRCSSCLLSAPTGSDCSSCLLLAPIGSHSLLLAPIGLVLFKKKNTSRSFAKTGF